MCGRTAADHGIVLQVDHKIPQAWGGGNELENLQPLCEECNRGRKDLFASYSEVANKIRGIITDPSVHIRIREFSEGLFPQRFGAMC